MLQRYCNECGHQFAPEELRYRSDDGFDYCTPNGCGQRKWHSETVDKAPLTEPELPIVSNPLDF